MFCGASNIKSQAVVVVLGAFCVLSIGLIMTSGSVYVMESRGFRRADDMIDANTKNGDGVPMDMTIVLQSVVICGSLAVVFAIFGCIGTYNHNRCLLTLYAFTAMTFASLFIAMGIAFLTDLETLEPQLEKQVKVFCEKAVYKRMTTQMRKQGDVNCDRNLDGVPPPHHFENENIIYEVPVASAARRGMHGIEVVSGANHLIGNYFSFPRRMNAAEDAVTDDTVISATDTDPSETDVSTGSASVPATNNVIPAEDECNDFCQKRAKLLSIMGGCKTLRYICDVNSMPNGTPRVYQVKKFVKVFIFGMIGFGVFLVASMLCTFCLMYTMTTKKQGRKAGGNMVFRLLCPCFKQGRSSSAGHSKLVNKRSERDGFLSDSDDDGME